jgi:predicted nucleic acid-binding protein
VKVVVDAGSAFIMLATPERVKQIFADATDVLAPELIVAELLNARWKIMRSGVPAPSLDSVLGLLDRIHLVTTLSYAADAASLAQRLDHPSYACLYAALAKREHAQLVIADRRLAAKLANEIVEVITL